jgi:hypothetical protein
MRRAAQPCRGHGMQASATKICTVSPGAAAPAAYRRRRPGHGCVEASRERTADVSSFVASPQKARVRAHGLTCGRHTVAASCTPSQAEPRGSLNRPRRVHSADHAVFPKATSICSCLATLNFVLLVNTRRDLLYALGWAWVQGFTTVFILGSVLFALYKIGYDTAYTYVYQLVKELIVSYIDDEGIYRMVYAYTKNLLIGYLQDNDVRTALREILFPSIPWRKILRRR